MANQYTNKRADIERLNHADMVQVLVEMKTKDRISDLNLIQYLMFDSGYNYTNAAAYTLLKDTKERIKEAVRELNQFAVEDVLSEMEADKQAAKQRGDYRLVLDYQKEIDKVAGHYKERIEINQDVTFKVKWGRD